MKKKSILFIITCLFLTPCIYAQVTIGSDSNPDASALLDIKNNPDNTSTKGLLFPRVIVADTAQFGLAGNSRTEGMVVYNIQANSKNYGKGLYYWNGSKWIYMKGTDSQTDWSLGGNQNGSLKTLGTKDNFDLPFITNNVERMRITTGARVGIGTTTPKAKFSVSGGPISLDDFTFGDKFYMLGYPNSAKISLGTDTTFGMYSGTLVRSDGVTPDNSNNGQFTWNVADASSTWREVMRITNNGNLGIGTTNPGAKLDVNGTTIFEGQVTMQSLPTANPTDYILTVDNNNTVRKSTVAIPQYHSNNVTIAPGATGAIALTINSFTYATITVTANNSCGDGAVATFNVINGLFSYTGGAAKGVNYTPQSLNVGTKIRLTASIIPCPPGDATELNMDVEYNHSSKVVSVTNNGTSTLTYTVVDVQY